MGSVKEDWTVAAGITSLSLMLDLMPNDVSEGDNETLKMVETKKGLNAFEVKKTNCFNESDI
jgi:hypothetical protein